ncbi:MAG: hypothetical protein AB1428_14265 [Bacteroidota bacterium]
MSIKPLLVDFPASDPASQLACDEVLLAERERNGGDAVLRFWEPTSAFVVLGYTCDVAREVRIDACRARRIPLFRRTTGGGAVVQAPGCLNFSLIVPINSMPDFATAGGTSAFIMRKSAEALQQLTPAHITLSGFSDLTVGTRKCAGSAQRRLQRFLLFHGSILLGLPLLLVEELLPLPSRQPAYRKGRAHSDFLLNLDLAAGAVREALQQAWEIDRSALPYASEKIRRLALDRYRSDAWTWNRTAPAPHGG